MGTVGTVETVRTVETVGTVGTGLIWRVFKQMKLLGECSGSIDSVRRLEHKLAEEESVPGFVNLNSTETQTAGE